MNLRIGHGYDVHCLAKGYEFWLGGIKIDYPKGGVGHSDADVLIHAICDSMLGAAAMQDIGYHFPDTDPKYKGIDSKKLLAEVHSLLKSNGYEIINIDSTVCLQKPKLRELIFTMRQTLADVLKISVENISIKATTTEKLGFIGREEGISAHAVTLLQKVN